MDPVTMIALGSTIAGTAAQIGGQQATNKQNKAEAKKNRKFQEFMSGTAHQREVADLKLAGLNPILSAGGGTGASTGSGAQATMQNPFEKLSSTALETQRVRKEVKQADSQIELNKASQIAATESAKVSQASAKKMASETKILKHNESSAKAEAEFRQEKSNVDKATYKLEKGSNILGGLIGNLFGGSAKGIKQLFKSGPRKGYKQHGTPKAYKGKRKATKRKNY